MGTDTIQSILQSVPFLSLFLELVLVDSCDSFTLRWEVTKTLELLALGDLSIFLLSFVNLLNHTSRMTRLPILRWMVDFIMRTI